jgi:DNA-binding transcriptional LysR family regulator
VLVPLALARFKQRHPRHTVLVREGSATALLPELRRGELDLVVGRVSSDVPSEGLAFEAFYNEPMQVVARVGHPLARRRRLALRDLAGERGSCPRRMRPTGAGSRPRSARRGSRRPNGWSNRSPSR